MGLNLRRQACARPAAEIPSAVEGHLPKKIWSGRMDLNHRPPGPEDCSHEESTTYTERYELLPSVTSAVPTAVSIAARTLGSTQ